MVKYFLFLMVLLPHAVQADIVIPTFFAHHNERNIYGEQIYSGSDVSGILWQLNYWSFSSLTEAALSQALNDVLSDKGKHTGIVKRGKDEYQLFHASAGLEKETATLFFIDDGDNQRIVGIGKHIPTKVNQAPKYEVISWDNRYNRLK